MLVNYADACPIGVFDSGLGGLSVLSEIHQLLPSEKLIYIGDSANSPYGDQSAEFVQERSLKITDFLLDQGVKIIVVACNTATVESISLLRNYADIPIIGLEPAVKPATELSQNGIIGVLATQRTIDSLHLLTLTERYANGSKVIAQACTGLVELVEAGELTSKATFKLLNQYIQPLLQQDIDTLVLGCTHYPFLRTAIRELVGDKINIVETAKPVARQLQRVLKKHQLENLIINDNDSNNVNSSNLPEQTNPPDITFYNSKHATTVSSAMQRLWQLSLTQSNTIVMTKAIEVLPLPALNYAHDR